MSFLKGGWLWVVFALLGTVQRVFSFEEDDGEAPDDEMDQDTLSSEQVHKLHGHLDLNKDGKASVQEIMAFAAEMRQKIALADVSTVMDEMDLNKDGVLDLEELWKDFEMWSDEASEDDRERAAKKELERAKFMAADLNGDQVLSPTELPGLFYPETNERVMELTTAAALKEKDTDGDGKLSVEEFWGIDGADQDLSATEEEHIDFNKLDTDGDGKLSMQELKIWESGIFHTEEAMKKLFEIADKDSDMHVTALELEAAKEAVSGTDAHYHLVEWSEHHEL